MSFSADGGYATVIVRSFDSCSVCTVPHFSPGWDCGQRLCLSHSSLALCACSRRIRLAWHPPEWIFSQSIIAFCNSRLHYVLYCGRRLCHSHRSLVWFVLCMHCSAFQSVGIVGSGYATVIVRLSVSCSQCILAA
jgi:hypothetical protein